MTALLINFDSGKTALPLRRDDSPYVDLDGSIRALRSLLDGQALDARETSDLRDLLGALETVEDFDEDEFVRPYAEDAAREAVEAVQADREEELLEARTKAFEEGYAEGRRMAEKAVRAEWAEKAEMHGGTVRRAEDAAKGRELREGKLVDRGYLHGDKSRARELRRDVRRTLGTSSDPVPTALEALNALRAMAALVELATGRNIGAAAIFQGHPVPTGDVIRAYMNGGRR